MILVFTKINQMNKETKKYYLKIFIIYVTLVTNDEIYILWGLNLLDTK